MKKVEIIGNIGKIEVKENSQLVGVCVNSSRKTESGEYENIEWWCNASFNKDVKLSVGDKVFVRGDFMLDTYLTKENQPAVKLLIFVKEYEVLMRKKREE